MDCWPFFLLKVERSTKFLFVAPQKLSSQPNLLELLVVEASLDQICIGNCMDESAIWKKIARQQENCTRQSRVLFELLLVQLRSMGLLINRHDLPSPSPSCH